MNATDSIMALIRHRPRRAGVLVLTREVAFRIAQITRHGAPTDTEAAGPSFHTPRGSLFGAVDQRDGLPIIRVQGFSPAAGLTRIGAVYAPGIRPAPGEALLTLSDPPTASLDGQPLEIVVCDPSRYRDRVAALPGASALEGKTAVLVGLGSVGSDIGTRLVRLGVRVIGCDPDLLIVENLIRWGLNASLEHVGRPKARVWEDLLRDTVPDARIDAHAIDVVRDAAAFDRIVAQTQPDLLITATDTADSRRTANAISARHRVPAVFIGLSDGAASVRIEVIEDARRGPCHLCSSRAEGVDLPGSPAARTSRTPYGAEPAPAQEAVAALPVDVAVGAAIATRIAILLLAGGDWRRYFRNGDQTGNVLFLSLRPDFWIFDGVLDRMVYQPEPCTDCPTCGGREEDCLGEQ